ncbi:MAG: DUF1934 domain-containing protein [Candidatus Faecousia sp.]|nr:DUF1934 domain-containing protein [Clostridiales bacterium]MDD7651716.1 DUF1934 domain-containing protein [Bacillota bacterium]MDY4219752.1 DUF1934 domain-containing protein [Candidatus Faecousia sp.]
MTVMLKIRGEQRYEGQEPEVVELTTEGVMTQTAEGWSISYEETDLTGLQGATTTFTVKPGHVTLTRTGTVQSSMVFQEGVRHESLYQLDVGALMVCVCARRIQTELSMEGGYLDVYYTIQIEQAMAGVVRYHIDVTPVK